jgi:hypothetical protein
MRIVFSCHHHTMSKSRDCKDAVQVLTGKIEKEVRELKPGGPKVNCFVTHCPKGDLCTLKNGGQIIWQQGSGYNNPFKHLGLFHVEPGAEI